MYVINQVQMTPNPVEVKKTFVIEVTIINHKVLGGNKHSTLKTKTHKKLKDMGWKD